MSWRVGVDTGGTFTDICLYEETTGEVRVGKVSSTPADPGMAVREGVRGLFAQIGDSASTGLGDVVYFAHGTTVATNALLESRGARTALITTAGFRDLLEIARQRRPKLYDVSAAKSDPVVPRHLRYELRERVAWDGTVLTALQDDDVRALAATLREERVEAVAVCFLYSYLRPEHEMRVREILAEELDGVYVSISSDVLPEFREYERTSTVAINASIGPIMRGYLSRLRDGLREEGLSAEPKVTQSNGGTMSFDLAGDLPVRTALSGPSTGVVGAITLAGQSGFGDIITFDMGGTSSDVSLIRGGEATLTNGLELDGHPIKSPMLDIDTVGAGGGSIAWVDAGGHLNVGPRSAGADPGPVCYGKGNQEPTVTDANVVLGTLNQTTLLGGAMPIDAALSHEAVTRLGVRLGRNAEETAQGIISVVTANMARAIRVISVQRGYDPADYALVAFGGAGPLHAVRLADELGIPRVLIPQRPGALSALGMLMTDAKTFFTVTAITALDDRHPGALEERFAPLLRQAADWHASENIPPDAQHVIRTLDLRFRGQNYELTVVGPDGPIDAEWVRAVAASFHEEHERRYGYTEKDAPIEAVTFRVEARGTSPVAEFPAVSETMSDVEIALEGHREVYYPEAGGRLHTPVYDRALLLPGARIPGPAIVEQYDSTTVVPPGYVVTVDRYLLMIIEKNTTEGSER